MKRTLAISDIHGCYNEFNSLLKESKYNPTEDKLILLGDYVDRGLKSKEVVEQVKNLVEEFNVIALKGNHDEMFTDAILNDDDFNFLRNGGFQTIESYVGLNWFDEGFDSEKYAKAKEFIKQHYSHHINFLNTLPYYHETDEFIFVHAGLNPMYENWKEQPEENFIWIREIFLNNPTQLDKTVVFGHTPTINIHRTEDIWFQEDKIGIDGGCCFGYQLNCLEISEEGYVAYSVNKAGRIGD